MKLIIDIPKDIIESAKSNPNYYPTYHFEKMWRAIVNGIPLPKGHGVLKDTDAICKDIISALGIRDENYLLEAEKAIYKRIKNATTIIEADTESEE